MELITVSAEVYNTGFWQFFLRNRLKIQEPDRLTSDLCGIFLTEVTSCVPKHLATLQPSFPHGFKLIIVEVIKDGLQG